MIVKGKEDTMARYLSELFMERPETFGARGDPFFWEHLEGYFSNVEFPYTEDWLTDDIYRLFVNVSGEQLTQKATPYVEEFAHGGMSSGVLCGEFWVMRAIPLLVERYRAFINKCGLQVYMGKLVNILSSDGKDYVGKIIDFQSAEDNISDKDEIILEKDKEFLIAFTRDDIATIRVCKEDVKHFDGYLPEEFFVGKIQRFKIVTNGMCYGPCPEPDDEVEQHLTVTRDGRVWFTGYNYGTWGTGKHEKGRTKQFKLSEEVVKPIFDAFQAYFSTGFIPWFATDIGSWEMTITTNAGDKAEFYSSYGAEMEYNGKQLTEIVSEILQIEDLWVFGGIDRYEEYLYCSVSFHPGGKTYYYMTEDENIKVGDYVVVSVGTDGKEAIVRVMAIEAYYEDEVPFPVDATRHIIRKCNENELRLKLDELWRCL